LHSYEPDGLPAEDITGVFSLVYHEVDLDEGPAVATNQPNLFVNLADLPAAVSPGLDHVTCEGTRYVVSEEQPDGEGGAVLLLNEDP
jgi:hypothetical protein